MDSPTRGLDGLDFSPYLQPPLDDGPDDGLDAEPPPDIPFDVAEDIMAASLAAGFELGRKAADEVLRDAAAGKRIGVVHMPGGLLRQPFMAAFDARMAEDWAEVLQKRARAEKAEAEVVADFASDLDGGRAPAPPADVDGKPLSHAVRAEVAWALLSSGLKPRCRLVLATLVALGGLDEGGVTATLEQLAESSGYSEQTVRRSVVDLEAEGYLKVDHDPGSRSTFRVKLG